jgi:transaldolase
MKYFSDKVKTNVTLVFSEVRHWPAAKAGILMFLIYWSSG